MTDSAEGKAIEAILAELRGRGGFDHVFDDSDDDVIAEMTKKLEGILAPFLDAAYARGKQEKGEWVSVEDGLPDIETPSDEPEWYGESEFVQTLPPHERFGWSEDEVDIAFMSKMGNEEARWTNSNGETVKVAFWRPIGPLPPAPEVKG